MSLFTILLIIIAVAVFWGISVYNKFVRLQTQTDESWADIDVQLKRRYDLIPNLIETVKGYVDHEAETLKKVTELRNVAMGAQTPAEHAQVEGMLTGALKSLFAVAENYPDLKANQNFMKLQDELSDTENKIQAARRFFNVNVRDFNIAVRTVPSNIIANLFRFTEKEFFDLDEAPQERENIKVDFSSKDQTEA